MRNVNLAREKVQMAFLARFKDGVDMKKLYLASKLKQDSLRLRCVCCPGRMKFQLHSALDNVHFTRKPEVDALATPCTNQVFTNNMLKTQAS